VLVDTGQNILCAKLKLGYVVELFCLPLLDVRSHKYFHFKRALATVSDRNRVNCWSGPPRAQLFMPNLSAPLDILEGLLFAAIHVVIIIVKHT
jgi:hypothetical protein